MRNSSIIIQLHRGDFATLKGYRPLDRMMAYNHIYEEGLELEDAHLPPNRHSGGSYYSHARRQSTLEGSGGRLDQEVVYEPEDHMSEALKLCSDMKAQDELCDVVILANETRFPAHRVILAAFSPYFRAMFTGNMKERGQEEIALHDVNSEALQLLLEFCYNAKLKITRSNVQCILPLANMLQMTGVCNACSNFLASQLHPSNILGIRKFADTHNCEVLLNRCQMFLQQRFPEIVLHEEFLQLTFSEVLDIVTNDHLNVRGEEQVYEAVISWVRHDTAERGGYIASLLKHVRMPLMTAVYLSREVKQESLVMESFEGRGLLIEAMDYHLRKNYLRDSSGSVKSTNTTPRRCPGLEHLFAIGGSGSPVFEQVPYLDLCECYDVEKDEWRTVAPLPKHRSGIRVASVGGYLYAIGGFSAHDMKGLAGVDRYDPMTDSWRPVAPMIQPRRGFAVVVLHNYIYAIGGINNGTYYNTVERYCPRNNNWMVVAPMNFERRALGAASLNGYIFAAGKS